MQDHCPDSPPADLVRHRLPLLCIKNNLRHKQFIFPAKCLFYLFHLCQCDMFPLPVKFPAAVAQGHNCYFLSLHPGILFLILIVSCSFKTNPAS